MTDIANVIALLGIHFQRVQNNHGESSVPRVSAVHVYEALGPARGAGSREPLLRFKRTAIYNTKMVFFAEGTRRLFTGEDSATLSSLIHLMPDISYDYALKKLRATAHEVSWLRSNKKDLIWDNCHEAIAAGMSVSKVFRIDCSRTLGVFVDLMFRFKPKYGTDMQCDEDEGSDSDLRGREDAVQDAEDDEATRGTHCIHEGADRNPGGTTTDKQTAGN
jgi:hypothetical protein